MAHSDVYPNYFFHSWQIWPGAYDNPCNVEWYPRPENIRVKMTQDTPIAIMGSCFGRAVKETLIADGYSVITEEGGHSAAKHASAAWERVYTTFCMRQIFTYSFDDWNPDLRWWQAPQTGVIQDPYRRIVVYPDQETAEADFAEHCRCSRRAVETARILILILEMTDIWEDMIDGAVISMPSGPYVAEGGDMTRYRFRVSRYHENLKNMEDILSIMARYNPDCHIILMVSPVHLWTTFRKDTDIISASCNAKATLRAMADDCASRCERVVYFPALEIATTYRSICQQPVFAAGRENFHISPDNFHNVMKQFYRFYSSP